MKNMFSNHYSKYKICYVIGIAIVVGIFLSTYFSELFEISIFDLRDIYLLFIVPLCSIFYGIVTHIKVRKIWISQLIFFIMLILGYLLLTFSLNGSFEKTGGIFILCIYPLVFSLFSAIVTAFILKIKNLMEK